MIGHRINKRTVLVGLYLLVNFGVNVYFAPHHAIREMLLYIYIFFLKKYLFWLSPFWHYTYHCWHSLPQISLEMACTIFLLNNSMCDGLIELRVDSLSWVGFPGGTVAKNLPASAGSTGDTHSILGLGISPEVGNGNPLQYSCLENTWTEEPSGLQSMGLQRVSHDWALTLKWSLLVFLLTLSLNMICNKKSLCFIQLRRDLTKNVV